MSTVWLLFVSSKLLILTRVEVGFLRISKMCSLNILRSLGEAGHQSLFCVQYLVVCELCEKRANLYRRPDRTVLLHCCDPVELSM